MLMLRLLGFYTLIPVTLFLAVSFFVLLAASKTELKKLKTFGTGLAVLLMLSALIVLISGIHSVILSNQQMHLMRQGMVRPNQQMQQVPPPPPPMPEEGK